MHPVHIGTAGWSIPRQHAEKAPLPGTHLERYARVFSCAEINSSFYRPHRAATWARWAESVGDNFRFSVKAPKTITHEAKLACAPEELQAFLDSLRPLGAKLSPILFQLPPKFAFDSRTADSFLTLYRELHHGPTVFEPRHPTWFTDEATQLLSRFQVARVAADPAPVPEAALPGAYPGLVYYRLHGSPRTYYSEYEAPYLRALATRILEQSRHAEIWCVFDNTTLGHALHNASALQELVALG